MHELKRLGEQENPWTDADRSIGQRFREFEQHEARAGEHERLRQLADELAGRYLYSTVR